MITVKHLRKEFANVTPLKDVNCTIEKGEVISIIGPSGTGKSTFLRCLNLLETPTSGEIVIDGINILEKGAPIQELRKKMGMVFQSFNLFSHLMVIENIMLGPVELLGRDRQAAYDRGLELLELVVNQLLPKMEGDPDLTLTAGYSEETGSVELTAAWPSEEPFPELFGQNEEEDISLLLLKKLLRGHTQTWEDGENRIRLEL